jgi:tetratricopeptide (TPR) repeat protein
VKQCPLCWLLLIGWLGFSTKVTACQAVLISLASNESVLVSVPQQGQDVVLSITDNGKSSTYNSALGHSANEMVLVPASNTSRQVSVCVLANKQDITQKYKGLIQKTTINQWPSNVIKILDQHTQAAALWASPQTKSIAPTSWLSANEVVVETQYQHYKVLNILNAAAAKVSLFDYVGALEAIELLNDHNGRLAYKLLWLKGGILYQQDQPEKALPLLQEAIKIAQPHSDLWLELAEIKSLLADIWLTLNNTVAAERLLHEALQNVEEESYLAGHISDNLGYLYVKKAAQSDEPLRTDYYVKAIAYEQSAKEIFNKTGYWQRNLDVENNLATIYERLGRLYEAQQHYRKALELLERTRDLQRYPMLYRNLAKIAQYLGDYQRSIALYQKAYELFLTPSPVRAARIQCELGDNYYHLGQMDKAKQRHIACEEYFRNTEHWHDWARSKMALANYALSAQQQSEAKRHLAPILKDHEKLMSKEAQVDFLLTQANILQVEKEEERAHTLVEKAISVASKARYPATLVDTLNMGVAIAIKQKRFDIANQYADRAIELTLNLHQYLDPQHFGPAWSGKTHELFANKINLLIKNTESTSSDTHAKIFKLLEQSATISIRRSTKINTTASSTKYKPHINKVSELQNQRAAKAAPSLNDPNLDALLTHHQWLIPYVKEPYSKLFNEVIDLPELQ